LLENYIIFAQLELMANDVVHHDLLRQTYQAQPDEIIRVVVQGKTAVNQRHVQLHLQAGSVTLPMSNDYSLKIIEELLDNACKFSPDDSTIEIYTAVSQNRFSLKVENSGRGMTPEQIRNIGLYMQFERRIYEQQGSGMGLVIVKRLVELHGGDISFASVPDEVTAVIITIPL
ncbi:MAG TPA: ATP-binding protein, partial [Anaerolineae bacterium]|nr:ATP-binding protein [Anaerolineae bacterium]